MHDRENKINPKFSRDILMSKFAPTSGKIFRISNPPVWEAWEDFDETRFDLHFSGDDKLVAIDFPFRGNTVIPKDWIEVIENTFHISLKEEVGTYSGVYYTGTDHPFVFATENTLEEFFKRLKP